MADSFMLGLLIGIAACVAVSISWGVFCLRLNDEWADYCEKEAKAWQKKCADIVIKNYVRRVIEGR